MVEKLNVEERKAKSLNGGIVLTLGIVLTMLFIIGIIYSSMKENSLIMGISIVAICVIMPIMIMGFKVIKPNEALVVTLFGKYKGTLKKEGFHYINPFSVGFNPAANTSFKTSQIVEAQRRSTLRSSDTEGVNNNVTLSKKISLKVSTLTNKKQKINDNLGNPIIVRIIVTWKVENTAKAVFNVENYKEYLTTQADSVLRDVVRLYPYDSANTAEGFNEETKSLRGSSVEISENIRERLQEKLKVAGLEILETKITDLSYAPEIASVMLQRQQASAIVDARQMIVDGAVGMVDMALKKLSENEIVDLDEERKAAMVSNLLVVLCSSKDTQPIVNSGSLY